LKDKGPLEEYALENIKNTTKIITHQAIEPEDRNKLLKTMKFLGYEYEENN